MTSVFGTWVVLVMGKPIRLWTSYRVCSRSRFRPTNAFWEAGSRHGKAKMEQGMLGYGKRPSTPTEEQAVQATGLFLASVLGCDKGLLHAVKAMYWVRRRSPLSGE